MLSDAYDEKGMPAWGLLAVGPTAQERAQEGAPAARVLFTGEPLQLDQR